MRVTMTNHEPVTILLVEDDAGHARLIEKNLRRAGISNPVISFGDGQKVLDFLFGEQNDGNSRQPLSLLVLLDLNIPGIDGYQVLKRIKHSEKTKHIPIVVLTTTDAPHEVSKCYELGCNVYITKPVDYEQFSEAIRTLGLFLSVVTIPGGL